MTHNLSCDIVTVVYYEEKAAVRLQARSIMRWLDQDTFDNIWVIINERTGEGRYSELREILDNEYKNAETKVNIIGRDEIDYTLSDLDGYVSQQILKLIISKIIKSEYYVILDAKNFLIDKIEPSYFIDCNKPKQKFELYQNSFQHYIIKRYYDLLGVDESKRSFNLPAMMTPFTFRVKTVTSAIDFVETALQQNIQVAFRDTFSKEYLYSEFCLFSVSMEALGLTNEKVWTKSDYLSMTLWEGYALGAMELELALNRASNSSQKIIGLHRKRVKQISSEEAIVLERFLIERKILERAERLCDGFI